MAPRDPIEQLVTEYLGGGSGLERVGVEDDFFERGGHSLLATQAMSRLRSALGCGGCASEIVRGSDGCGPREGDRAEPRGRGEKEVAVREFRGGSRAAICRLSFAQQRLWFLDSWSRGATYNIPGAGDPGRTQDGSAALELAGDRAAA